MHYSNRDVYLYNSISGQTENMPFILSVGTAFSGGADFSLENENLENNHSPNNGTGQQSENSSTIYNI